MGRSSGTNYGCRGGASATAGKKKARYEVVGPDGVTHKANSFKVTSETAWFHFAKDQDGETRMSGPHRDTTHSYLPAPDNYWRWTDYQWVEGRRL